MTSRTLLPLLVLLAAAIAVPAVLPSAYWEQLLATGLIFGILAMSLDVLWGYAGILTLAPAIPFGLGAYTWTLVTAHVSGSGGTAVALAAVLAIPASLAAAIAYVAFRAGAKGIYFALITLAVGLALQEIAQSWTAVTGGSNGLLGIAWPTLGVAGLQWTLDRPAAFYELVVAVTAIVFALCARFVHSRRGTVLQAIRESEVRAETLGYSTLWYRVLVSAVSAAIGGLAGALYAPVTGIADPTAFGVPLSVQIFVWLIVGGQSTLFGPLLGAVVITVAQAQFSGAQSTLYLLAMGVIFMVFVIVLPGGIASLPLRLRTQLRARSTRPAPVRDA